MIRLWLARDTGTPIQEQLSAQFVLGILSRRLTPGEKLPSVRALGRQLKLHPNTVSAVYRVLVERGWLKRRRGSGVYVRQLDFNGTSLGSAEAFARSCFQEGLARGFSLELLQQAFIQLAYGVKLQHFIVIDPDPHLAAILAAEIGEALGVEIPFASDIDAPRILNSSSCALVTQASAKNLRSFEAVDSKTIRLKSMQDLLLGRERPPHPVLVAVVSTSPSVRSWAATLLSALGFSDQSMLLRDPLEPQWCDGLDACEIVAGDVLIAPELARHVKQNVLTFRLVSADSLAEICALQKNTASGSDR